MLPGVAGSSRKTFCRQVPSHARCPAARWGAVLQAQSPPSSRGGLGDPLTGRQELAQSYGWFFLCHWLRWAMVARTSWATRNTTPRYRRSLPCCPLSQASQLHSLQAAPFHNPFKPIFFQQVHRTDDLQHCFRLTLRDCCHLRSDGSLRWPGSLTCSGIDCLLAKGMKGLGDDYGTAFI